MTVKIVTKTSQQESEVIDSTATEVVNTEEQAAAEMAAKAQQADEGKVVPTEEPFSRNPDDNVDDWKEFVDDDEPVIEEIVEPVIESKVVEGEDDVAPVEVPVVETEEIAEVIPDEPKVVEEEIVEKKPVEEPVIVEVEEPQETRTPEEVTKELKVARESAHKVLMEQYVMTDEQVENFRDDPSTALATMAADMYLDTYDSIMGAVHQQVPQMIQSFMAQQEQRTIADKLFFDAWPQLNKAEYRATIDRIAQSYRTMHPKTSNEDAIKEIGAQVWVSLRLPLEGLLEHTSGKPVVEEPPLKPKVVRIPAGHGKAAAVHLQPAKENLNEFEILAEEFIQDDLAER